MMEDYTMSRNHSLGKLKSNCSNTLSKFVLPEVERVTKLNFYNSDNKSTIDLLYQKQTEVKNMGKASASNSFYKSIKSKNVQHQHEKEFRQLEKERKIIQTLDRMENNAYECELENKRKNLEKKIKSKNKDKETLLQELTNIDNIQKEKQMSIEVLDHIEEYYDLNERIKRSIELKDNYEIKLRRIDSEKFLKVRASLKNFAYDKHEENKKLKEEIRSLMNDKVILNEKCKLVKQKKTKYIDELTSVKNELLVHYHRLLNEGKDTRNEGLTWIIKAIWGLGHNVLLSYLPKYLDEECILYLFNYSKRDLYSKKLVDRIYELKEMIKIGKLDQVFKTTLTKKKKKLERKNNSGSNLENLGFAASMQRRNELIDNQIDPFQDMDEKDCLSFKKISKIIDSNEKNKIDNEALKYLNQIKSVEKELSDLKTELILMKNNELKRINKEFLINDYNRRFNVNQETVLSAIMGEDTASTELIRQLREQKNYYKSLKMCSTFNFLEGNKIKNYGD